MPPDRRVDPHLAVRIREYGAGDGGLVEAVVAVRNAARAWDAPWAHHETPTFWSATLSHGWDGDPPLGFVALQDGRAVGAAELWRSSYDNETLADVDLVVHPDHRRRGVGTGLLGAVAGVGRRLGCTSLATGGWDSAAAHGFARSHGLEPKQVNVARRQMLAEVDAETVDGLHAEAARDAAAYRLMRIRGRTPDALVPALARLTESINDAPMDDLEIDDERFPPERVVSVEATVERTRRLYRVIAQHRETGELAGHTWIAVDRERPQIGRQEDTAVARKHRGHRLGVLLKTEAIRWLRDAEPQLETVDTWNAKSNRHMIAVNEALGYRVLGESVTFQGAL
ncbi:MAG: GNAT family N-acetyltransferase [Nocardioides sp.]